MRIAASLLTALMFTSTALAADQNLLGVWVGGDRAAEAIYGTLTITKKNISWPHTNNLPKCTAKYEVILMETGDSFPDQSSTFKHLVEGRRFTTVKLKLESKKCVGSLGFLQFSFPSDIPGYADVVEYDKAGKPNGWIHFHKRD